MKTRNKTTMSLLSIMAVFILLSATVYAQDDYFGSARDTDNLIVQEDLSYLGTNEEIISLDDAVVIAMMNYRGELKKSYEIQDLNGEPVFFVKLLDDNVLKLVMVESTGNFNLVEEVPAII